MAGLGDVKKIPGPDGWKQGSANPFLRCSHRRLQLFGPGTTVGLVGWDSNDRFPIWGRCGCETTAIREGSGAEVGIS